jgi:hypothetical protein
MTATTSATFGNVTSSLTTSPAKSQPLIVFDLSQQEQTGKSLHTLLEM